jgi:shikimate kinase
MQANIILIGFMGSGKSVIGKRLSEKLKMEYLDMDERIQEKLDMTMNEIFKLRGETFFRREELLLLQQIQADSNMVIATGGGIILQRDCMDILSNMGIIFYLKCSFKSINQRIRNENTRPLYNHQNLGRFRKLYKSRLKLYEKNGDYVIDTDGKEVEKICSEIEFIFKKR